MEPNDKPTDQQTDDLDEQSTTDQAGEEESGVDEGDADGEEKEAGDDESSDDTDADDDSDDESGDGEQLIDDEKFNALKDDPVKLRKELNRAATKKFQDLAKARKAVEPYADFISAFEDDPEGATFELAQQLGLKVDRPKSEAEAEKAAVKLQDRVAAAIKKSLGPEYEDLADKISAGVYEASIDMFNELAAPLKQEQNRLISDAAATTAATVIRSFEKSHPDWKQHEAEMTRLMAKFPPSSQVTELEYLDSIYTLATSKKATSKKVGDKTKKVIERMTRNVQRSEGKSRTASDSNVSKGPSGRAPSWDEAKAAALRGERLD